MHVLPVFFGFEAKLLLFPGGTFQKLSVPESISVGTLALSEVCNGDLVLGCFGDHLGDFAPVDLGDVGVHLENWDHKMSLLSSHASFIHACGEFLVVGGTIVVCVTLLEDMGGFDLPLGIDLGVKSEGSSSGDGSEQSHLN